MNKKIIFTLLLGLCLSTTLGSCAAFNSNSGPNNNDIVDIDTSFEVKIHQLHGKVETKKIKSGEILDLNTLETEHNGYKFVGFYLDSEYKTKLKETKITYNLNIREVYLKYEFLTEVNFTFSYPENEETVVLGFNENVSLREYKKKIPGKIFEGFYWDKEFTQKIDENIIVAEKDKIIYCKYVDSEVLKLNLIINGETKEYKLYKNDFIKSNNFFKEDENFIFEGWYLDADFTQRQPNNFILNNETTLYVNWVYKEKISVPIHNLNNKDYKIEAFNMTFFDLSTIKTEKHNYIFKGWYLDPDFTTPIENNQIRLKKGMEIFAKYDEKVFRDINAVIPDGNGAFKKISLNSLHIDDKIDIQSLTELANLPENINFEGWFLNEKYTNPLLDNTIIEKLENEVINNTITIYAKTSVNLDFYLNDNLENTFILPYGTSLTPEVFLNLSGENYRLESISLKDSLILKEHYTVNTTGKNYLDFTLNDGFEYNISGNNVIITNYKGSNPFVKVPAYIDSKKVTEIKSDVFPSHVISVVLPNTLEKIDSNAFRNAPKIVEIYNLSNVSFNNNKIPNIYNTINEKSKLSIIDKEYVIYKNENKNYLIAYLGVKPKLTLPEKFNNEKYELYDYAFADNQFISTLIIPEGIENISNFAFSNNYSLKRVVLPTSLKEIGMSAFENCYGLIEVYNHSNINITTNDIAHEGLGQYALHVYGKEQKTFTDKLSSAEYEINGFKYEFLIYNENNNYYILGLNQENSEKIHLYLPNDINGNPYEIYHHAFYKNKTIIDAEIPEVVTKIGISAFEKSDSLQTVSLQGTEIIGKYAFANCFRINSFTIPKTIKIIDDYAFANCVNMTSFKIEEGLETIGEMALSNLNSIKELKLPNSLLEIGEKALFDTKNIISLELPFIGETRESINNGYIGFIFGGVYDKNDKNGIINLGVPNSLKKVVITDDKEISSQAFWKVSGINEIAFLNTEKIGSNAFSKCSVKILEFPTNKIFTEMANDAFFDTSINEIKIDDFRVLEKNNNFKNIFFKFDNSEKLTTKISTYHKVSNMEVLLKHGSYVIGQTLNLKDFNSFLSTLTVKLENNFKLNLDDLIISYTNPSGNLMYYNPFKIEFKANFKINNNNIIEEIFNEKAEYKLEGSLSHNNVNIKIDLPLNLIPVIEPDKK